MRFNLYDKDMKHIPEFYACDDQDFDIDKITSSIIEEISNEKKDFSLFS